MQVATSNEPQGRAARFLHFGACVSSVFLTFVRFPIAMIFVTDTDYLQREINFKARASPA